MKRLPALPSAMLMALSVMLATPVHAQSTARPAATAKPAATEMAEAEVRTVDRKAKSITLKHGEIKNLNMGPMTMMFDVADAKLLEKVRPGDKIRFTATDAGGKYTVTAIEPAK